MKRLGLMCCVLLLVLCSLPSGRSFAQGQANNEMITFNFVDVEIPTVVKFISDITGKNFIFDERIKGKITIIAPARLTVDESFSLFTSILSLKGYTIVPSGPETYKIIQSSLAKQMGIITEDDKLPVNEAYITKLIPTEHIKAEDTLQFLRPVVSRDGHISVFGPRNLLLIVDSARNIRKITSILEKIDKPTVAEEESAINVYFLENADSTELAAVLQGVIKDLETAARQAARTTDRKKPFANQNAILRVTPDKTTNSLIIVAPPSEYDKIVSVIKSLDRKRKQVFVEAMIVEASIDRLKELGTKWRAAIQHDGEPVAIGGFGNVNTGTIQSIMTGLTGFSAGGMGDFLTVPVSTVSSSGTISTENLTAPGFAALFSMNYFEDAVNVLSTPQILTSDNEEAEIIVGENVPFISSRERDVTTTNTVLSSIERKDVGITLRITPQITEGDYVKLNIYQEISAVKSTTESIFTSVGPTTTKRSTKTSILAKDGQTVVISGLMQEEEKTGTAKTPILGDIPILGWLFKFKTVERDKTNLLVFLSPHIVKEAEDFRDINKEQKEQLEKSKSFHSREELLVRFKEGVSRQRASRIILKEGAMVLKYFEDLNSYHIKLNPDQTTEDGIHNFTQYPEVKYAEPNYRIKGQEKTQKPADKSNRDDADNTKDKSTINEKDDIQKKTSPDTKPESGIKPDVKGPSFSIVNDEKDIDPAQIIPQLQRMQKKTVSAPDKEAQTKGGKSDRMEGPESAAAHETGSRYIVQAGAWTNAEFAQITYRKLKNSYPDTYMISEGRYTKVRIPVTGGEESKNRIMHELKEEFNINPVLIERL